MPLEIYFTNQTHQQNNRMKKKLNVHVNHLQIAFQAEIFANGCERQVDNSYETKNVSYIWIPIIDMKLFFLLLPKEQMAKLLSQIKSSTRTRIMKISRTWTIHSIKMTATTTPHHTISPPHDIEYYDGNDFTNNFQCCHRCMSVHIVLYDAYQSSIYIPSFK